MIISGLQTGNTRWLAAHLQNAADNETIELAEITGTVAQDIDGALAEFDAITAGTRAREGVYAAFINPPQPLTREQFMRAIEVIAGRLGLAGQPRIVLFHTKEGRHHCHVVWSRIDIDRMKAIQLSHDRQKLRSCAQELAAEFGLDLPPGLQEDRGAARFEQPKQPTKAEKAMAEKSGISVEERRDAITACYRQADSAEAFVNALEAAGYMLARGDSRAFVVVDIAGDVHSLARQIEGAKTKDVKAKLEGVNLSLLPPVERAKVLMAQRALAQQDAARSSAKRQAEAKEAAEKLKAVQRKRRGALDLLWQKMKIRQMHEWKVLLAHIKGEEDRRLRRHWLEIGLARYLKKIAVIRQLLEYYADRRKRSLEEYHQQLKESLRRRHENEARELRRRYEALMRLERREFMAPVFACWQGAGDQADPVTYSFGQHETYWTGGWYGMTARTEEDAPFPDQDPAEYMRPAAEYEMAFAYEPAGRSALCSRFFQRHPDLCLVRRSQRVIQRSSRGAGAAGGARRRRRRREGRHACRRAGASLRAGAAPLRRADMVNHPLTKSGVQFRKAEQ
jgi:hypothetical protein